MACVVSLTLEIFFGEAEQTKDLGNELVLYTHSHRKVFDQVRWLSKAELCKRFLSHLNALTSIETFTTSQYKS